MGGKAHAVFLGPKVALGLDLADLSFLAEGSGGKGPAVAAPVPISSRTLSPEALSSLLASKASQLPRAPVFRASAADPYVQP